MRKADSAKHQVQNTKYKVQSASSIMAHHSQVIDTVTAPVVVCVYALMRQIAFAIHSSNTAARTFTSKEIVVVI